MMRCTSALAIALALVTVAPPTAAAQSAENVAVVINETSSDSQKIGQYYVEKRAIPAANVIRIKTLTTETIQRPAYVATIEQPIGAAIAARSLQDRVLYIVLTKGLPLRIAGTGGLDGTVSSVDSELTLLYRRMVGRPVGQNGVVDNPYFLAAKPLSEARPFTHRTHDIFLVTRLDGFSVFDVLGLVDRAQKPSPGGRVVLDQRLATGEQSGNDWLAEAAQRLEAAGHGNAVVLEKSLASVRATDQVIGYYSWGSNDIANRKRRFGMAFVPGAVAGTFVSTDARTFKEPPVDWAPLDWNLKDKWFGGSPQTLIGDLIREGVTGVAGHVAEPYLQSTVRPQILFPTYFAGFNLAEAFYLAIPHLSWQTVVIGDPLCTPFVRKALTRTEIEDPLDPSTELPKMFSDRRVEALGATLSSDARVVRLALLAESRLARGEVVGARQSLEQATELAPSITALQLQLALLYEQANDFPRAKERYQTILQQQPNHVTALNNLAYGLAVHEKALSEALPLAKRAAVLAPTNPTIVDTLAWIAHLQGNNDIASKLLTAALKQGGHIAEIRVHAAIVYAEMGAWAASETQLREALKLSPSLSKREDIARLQRKLMEPRK